MQSKLDEAKADLLARAAEAARQASSQHGGGGENGAGHIDLDVLLRRYYRHTAPDDLIGRDPVDVYGAAISHCRLAASRPQGTAKVRAYTPSVEENGWASGHTVIEIVTDDMSFLVDSVTNELSRQDRAIHVVIHPQLVVRRDITGKLLEILDVSDAVALPDDAVTESWMHIEIDRETDRDDVRAIEQGLQRVMGDVREVVEDWHKMRETAVRLADELADEPPALPAEEIGEGWELLRWLAEDHFTFLGYREYDLVTEDGEDVLRAIPGTGLGILRPDQDMSQSFSRLSTEARAKAREKKLLILTKANSRSTVHRSAYLDYVGVKKFDADGNVVGERRFLGLFGSSIYTESVTRIPVVRRKVHEVLELAGFPPISHDGRDLLQILETYPRDDLFQIQVPELYDIAISVLYLQERRRLRLFLRKDEYGRFYSALVYLPRDRYTTEIRLRMQDILLRELGGSVIDFTARNTESVLARLHFTVRVPSGATLGDPDIEHIERQLAEATRSWADDFAEALVSECGEEPAAELSRKYAKAFSEGYKSDFSPRTAVADLRRIEALDPDPEVSDFTLNLYQPIGALPGERRFKVYRTGGPLSLSEVLPILQRMGLEVVDERPYELRRSDGRIAWVYDFGLRHDAELIDATDDLKQLFQDAFSAVWTGKAESDGFNALVLRAGLTWRQAMVLRAYAKYLRQAGTTFSQDYIEDALTGNVHIARLLVNLFEARFSPGHQQAGTELVDGMVEELEGALDQVASLDEDRILRSFVAMVRATLRTNFFQRRRLDGDPHEYISLKFDPSEIPDLPAPRPKFEIFVYSPRVEGVHLRFGAVARGGLRWSDRREDFRTEILGLVKAQMVKNTVIVPVGAKGGFVCKHLPDPAVNREAWLAEGIACYKTFISGLLDITDNLVGGQVVPPSHVVRHDGDDTYLVVAADKGTATFSDIANEVAGSYGFWLGDAFASGGSAGYDHKGMGITARGAWESVKRHFRELGHDTQTQDFTVVGIGDMSGDVFGNGMLLSEHIRLVAAFDHRHIFLDPDPDAAASYAERRRLFDLPRSSWADYDTELISAGGGVFPRSAKSVQISPQVRERLGLAAGVSRLSPAELMKAILQSPVDLFWNGGIGTYIKASTESNADVGDKSNDAIRVNGGDLRVKVVGEGGNLGCTQLGRVEFALAGGRINTDAIDNSAGVDTSDHEVNIKILLNQVVAAGDLTGKQRNELLSKMTDEVGHLVLENNYDQNFALTNAVAQAPSLLHVHMRYLRKLVRDGHLDREIEFLPNERQLRERLQAGGGLTQPELAVLLAYTKIVLAQELLASDLPDEDYLRGELHRYFPTALRSDFAEEIDTHALRREIITTRVVNDLVNLAGSSFMFRMREESGAAADEVARAHLAARQIFRADDVLDRVKALDNQVDAAVQTKMRLHLRRLVERSTRWMLSNRREIDIAAQLAFFGEGVADVVAHLPKLLRGSDLEWMDGLYAEFTAAGVPHDLATTVAGFSSAYAALDIVEVARDSGHGVVEVAEVYFDLVDRLPIAMLLDRIIELPRDDRWKSMARASLREDLYGAQAGLTFDVLSSGGPDDTPELRFKAWEEKNASVISRARTTLEELAEAETYDLATLSVAMRVVRTLLRSGSMG
ncbi:NAD-glutamate dehydrogenase [Yinghuangia seranimata]|uniref:NAD-glutamate dehydrogenase n=1 Tax=Yinghuangia seranimata TaxID=408067 RepID=UPI00248B990D|nr:NAD-glutamate dehydrogenase [Yinghuangia seranimata]MDI2131425.1 NAD-glutamate dehydrogenase [Yinghuangia seranimata]